MNKQELDQFFEVYEDKIDQAEKFFKENLLDTIFKGEFAQNYNKSLKTLHLPELFNSETLELYEPAHLYKALHIVMSLSINLFQLVNNFGAIREDYTEEYIHQGYYTNFEKLLSKENFRLQMIEILNNPNSYGSVKTQLTNFKHLLTHEEIKHLILNSKTNMMSTLVCEKLMVDLSEEDLDFLSKNVVIEDYILIACPNLSRKEITSRLNNYLAKHLAIARYAKSKSLPQHLMEKIDTLWKLKNFSYNHQQIVMNHLRYLETVYEKGNILILYFQSHPNYMSPASLVLKGLDID